MAAGHRPHTNFPLFSVISAISIYPNSSLEGNQRPIRRNPLIVPALYYSRDMESSATGLKRIKDACDAAGCRVEFETLNDGFVVVFYRNVDSNLTVNHQDNTQDNAHVSFEERLLQFCRTPGSKKEFAEYMGYKDSKSFGICQLIT